MIINKDNMRPTFMNYLGRTLWLKRLSVVACAIGLGGLITPAIAEIEVSNNQKTTYHKVAGSEASKPMPTQQPSSAQSPDSDQIAPEETFVQTVRFLRSDEVKQVVNRYDAILRRSDEDLLQLSLNRSDDVAKIYQQLGMVLEFATVQGSLGGAVTGMTLAKIPAESESFTLTLPAYIKASRINMPNFTINTHGKPVKFARLSTISRIDTNRPLSEGLIYNQGGAFADGKSLDGLSLVYTSDKVDFSGVESMAGMDYEFDVSLPSQGWHWLRFHEKGNKTRITRVQSNSVEPIFVAF